MFIQQEVCREKTNCHFHSVVVGRGWGNQRHCWHLHSVMGERSELHVLACSVSGLRPVSRKVIDTGAYTGAFARSTVGNSLRRLVGRAGIEPATNGLKGHCSTS